MFHPDPTARARIRAALGAPADRVVVVAVSRLVRHKGYPELAAAMRDLPDTELWVVGERLDSDRGDDIRALLTDAGLGDRLRLLGYRDDVAAVLAAADIFALPSYFEGLPMSVIEAMLTGLPVVASDIEGPREQVVPEVTGLLVPPRLVAPLAAALRRLAGDPALRAAMGEAGRARALQLYDEAKVLARTLEPLGCEPAPDAVDFCRNAAPAGFCTVLARRWKVGLGLAAQRPKGYPAPRQQPGSAMTDIVPIRRALISVSDKDGLVPFAQALAARGSQSCPPADRRERCATPASR